MKTLDAKTIEITSTESSRLNIRIEDGTVHEDVHFTSLFPLHDANRCVSVSRGRDRDWVEVGIIEHLDQLPADQRKLVEHDISLCYFLPEITDVKKVIQVRGMQEWHVVTDRGPKVFYLMARKENVVMTKDGLILITDMDKCRYRITDYQKLRPEAWMHVERIMP